MEERVVHEAVERQIVNEVRRIRQFWLCDTPVSREHFVHDVDRWLAGQPTIASGQPGVGPAPTLHIVAVADASISSPQGTFSCPICGSETPHGHGRDDIFVWLDAQASRFGYRLEDRHNLRPHVDLACSLAFMASRMEREDIQQTPAIREVIRLLRAADANIQQLEAAALPVSAQEEIQRLKGEVGQWRANCESYGEQYRQMLDRLVAAGFPIPIPSDSLPPYWQVTDIIIAHAQKSLPVSAPAWQDISTAPKKGEILLWWPYWSRRPTIGYWKHDRWIAENALQDSIGALSEGPTHWMPLPDPPVSAPAGASKEEQHEENELSRIRPK